jgi:hypothetical protein
MRFERHAVCAASYVEGGAEWGEEECYDAPVLHTAGDSSLGGSFSKHCEVRGFWTMICDAFVNGGCVVSRQPLSRALEVSQARNRLYRNATIGWGWSETRGCGGFLYQGCIEPISTVASM